MQPAIAVDAVFEFIERDQAGADGGREVLSLGWAEADRHLFSLQIACAEVVDDGEPREKWHGRLAHVRGTPRYSTDTQSNPAIAERSSGSAPQSLRSGWIVRSTGQCHGVPSPRARRPCHGAANATAYRRDGQAARAP